MCKGGTAEAWRKFFSNSCAASLGTAFQNQRLKPGLCQIEGSHKPVVAATDDDDVASLSHALSGSVFQNFQRRKPSGRAHNAASWMCGRAAHIKVLDGRAELRITRYRTQKEKLLQRKLALENIAFTQTEFAFQIQRREHLFVEDDA